MISRKKHKLEQRSAGFTYGEAEIALAKAIAVDAQHRGLLRARLKNLMRLGLPGIAAGKGARTRYSKHQIAQWLLAMIIADIGIDPTVIVQAIKTQWKNLAPGVELATGKEAQQGKSVWLVLWTGLAGSSWIEGESRLSIQMLQPDPRSDELMQLMLDARERGRWFSAFDFTKPSNVLNNNLPPRP